MDTKFEDWKNTGPVPIGGHFPMAIISVEVHENGVAVDPYWRKRQKSELKSGRGYLEFPKKEEAEEKPQQQSAGPSIASPEPNKQALNKKDSADTVLKVPAK